MQKNDKKREEKWEVENALLISFLFNSNNNCPILTKLEYELICDLLKIIDFKIFFTSYSSKGNKKLRRKSSFWSVFEARIEQFIDSYNQVL